MGGVYFLHMSSAELIKRIKRAGFELVSTKGSHHKFRNGDRMVIVPHPKKDLPTGLVRQILKQAGIE